MENNSTKIVNIPNINKIRNPFQISIRSATQNLTIFCSRDILQIRSLYFKEIIDSKTEDEEIILPEEEPVEASLFLLDIHNLSFSPPHIAGSTRGSDLKWNKIWALLSVKWRIDEYTEAYAQLITQQLNSIIASPSQPNNPKKQRACSMCQRALAVAHSGHNNVWCSYCGAYANTILVSSTSSTTQSTNIALFWEIVEVVLAHPCFQRPPLESREDLALVLSRHRELWSKDFMVKFLDKEDFFQLCSAL